MSLNSVSLSRVLTRGALVSSVTLGLAVVALAIIAGISNGQDPFAILHKECVESPFLAHFLTGGCCLYGVVALNYVLGKKRTQVPTLLFPESKLLRALIATLVLGIAYLICGLTGSFDLNHFHLEETVGLPILFSAGVGAAVGLSLCYVFSMQTGARRRSRGPRLMEEGPAVVSPVDNYPVQKVGESRKDYLARAEAHLMGQVDGMLQEARDIVRASQSGAAGAKPVFAPRMDGESDDAYGKRAAAYVFDEPLAAPQSGAAAGAGAALVYPIRQDGESDEAYDARLAEFDAALDKREKEVGGPGFGSDYPVRQPGESDEAYEARLKELGLEVNDHVRKTLDRMQQASAAASADDTPPPAPAGLPLPKQPGESEYDFSERCAAYVRARNIATAMRAEQQAAWAEAIDE